MATSDVTALKGMSGPVKNMVSIASINAAIARRAAAVCTRA